MKRPLAMKCTQKQFDSIKDRLVYDECDIDDFSKYPYISNFYHKTDDKIGNTKWLDNYKEIHETFNADIFLEACGVEVEKVWKGTDMQFKMASEWVNCDWIQEFRFKPQPNHSIEIEALQQKAKENGMKVVINFEKL